MTVLGNVRKADEHNASHQVVSLCVSFQGLFHFLCDNPVQLLYSFVCF